jgi:predicted transcriptional regulator
MSQPLPDATEAEWAVMELLWEKEPLTVRQLADALYPRGGASEYATVHKLLERLKSKGYVRRARTGSVYVFHADVRRDDVIGQQLEALVEKMCGGSLQVLLSNLVRVKRLTRSELRELFVLVDELESKKRSDRDRR